MCLGLAKLVVRDAQTDADQEVAQRLRIAQLADAGKEAEEDLLTQILVLRARVAAEEAA
jgi:hypothetical protein